MRTANIDIRTRLIEAGVMHKQLAKEIGIAETSLSRKLRKELSDEEKENLIATIEYLAMKNKRKKGGKKK